MPRYFIDSSGRCHGECIVDTPANPEDLLIIERSAVVGNPMDYSMIDGELVLSMPPNSMDNLKADKNSEINAARAAANSSSFTHDGHQFACDALSRSDIDGITGYVALNDAFPPAFPGAWKAIDNSYYPLPDVAAWKGFLAAMVAAGSANFAHAQQLKQALADATTPEAVAAIAWTNI